MKIKKLAILLALVPSLWLGAQAQRLIHPNPSREAAALKAYMDDIYGRQQISGQYWDTWCTWVKNQTGRTPAILGLDFMDYTPRRRQEGANPTDTEKAIDWFNNKKGIVTFSWHWDAPTDIYDQTFRQECQGTTGGNARWYKAFYTCATFFDVNAAVNSPGSTRYNMLIRDIDIVAAELKKLQEAGVPVLWRPLHEASGAWFWWGARGAAPCKQLWRIMYDRLVNHHQLNNLIWVWNCYGSQYGNALDWYPGDNYVDIIAYDYPRGSSWNEYQQFHGNRGKLFGLAEVAGLPDPNNFNNQSWSYFVTWGDFIQNSNSVDFVRRVYNDPRVVTLENLPDIRTYLNITNTANLALRKPVTVSSTEPNSVNVAANAVDGRMGSRWSSAYADPQSITVDLGAQYDIDNVILRWEAAAARAFTIQVSPNGSTWTTIYSTSTGNGGVQDLRGLSGTGRFVRLTGTARTSTWGYSLYEFEVYGRPSATNIAPIARAGVDQTVTDQDNNGTESISLDGNTSTDPDGTTLSFNWSLNGTSLSTASSARVTLPVGRHTIALEVTDALGAKGRDTLVVTVNRGQVITSTGVNIALNRPVSVSSTEAGFGNIASRAVDGNLTTRWSSTYADPQWISVDLGATYQINRVQLQWETAAARAYRIDVSNDGTTWNTIFQTSTGDGGIDNLTGLNGTGRFVRVFGTARATQWGYSLFEFEVYGNMTAAPTVYEAEAAALTGVVVENAVSGFSGTGYVNGFDVATDRITFTVPQARAGNVNLNIRYGTPFGVKRNFVFVNGVSLGEIEFPAVTGWGTVSIPNVALQAGNNTIEIRHSWGWFLVDRISLSQFTARAENTAQAGVADVYPVPTSDILNVYTPAEAGEVVDIQLSRIDGVVVMKSQASSSLVQLDLSHLPTGVYLLTTNQGGVRKTKLVEKQ